MSDRLIPISPGSPEWDAWLRHHRGTKTEARMLVCQAEVRPFFVRTRMPPQAPRADQLTKTAAVAIAAPFPMERVSVDEGLAAIVGDRLLARHQRQERDDDERRRLAKSRRRTDQILEDALNAAAQNERPNVDECDELGVIEVVDPSEEVQLERIGRGAPMMRRPRDVPRQRRVISLRGDHVGWMAKRRLLGDGEEGEIRLKAARHYEALYARAEIGGARGIDPTRDIVDGGCFIMPDTEARITAQRKLAELDAELGSMDAEIVRAVLVLGLQIKQIAQAHGHRSWRDVSYYSQRFRGALDVIANHIGLKPRPAPAIRNRDSYVGLALYAENPVLHEAIHRAKAWR